MRYDLWTQRQDVPCLKSPLRGVMCILLFDSPPVGFCESMRNMNSSPNINVDVDSSSLCNRLFLVSVEHSQWPYRIRRPVLQRLLGQAVRRPCVAGVQKKSS